MIEWIFLLLAIDCIGFFYFKEPMTALKMVSIDARNLSGGIREAIPV